MPQTLPDQHTPPLGFKILTPLYDRAIVLLTREHIWRSKFVQFIDPQPSDFIVDVGSGTGSLAKALLSRQPNCAFFGIDPDKEAIARAVKKLSRHNLKADFVHGYLERDLFDEGEGATKIVSSLVLHQVPLPEKSRILMTIHHVLQDGGMCLIADYGHQKTWLSRLLFRLTVQVLDGKADTQPNADGILPDLMREAGFEDVQELSRISTPTGVISIYQAVKPTARLGGSS